MPACLTRSRSRFSYAAGLHVVLATRTFPCHVLRCWLPLPCRLPIASRVRRSSPHCLPRRCRPSPSCCSNSNPHSLRCSSRPTWVPQSLRSPRARLLVQAWALEPMEANLEQSCRISSDCLGTSVVSASNTQVEVIVLPRATSLMSKFPIPIDQVH